MQAQGKKLGILLAVSVESPRFQQALKLADDALAEGVSTYLYCLHDAVSGVAHPQLPALRARGLKLFACAYAARRRNLPLDDQAVYSGLAALSDLMAHTDAFASFGPGPQLETAPRPMNGTVAVIIRSDPHRSDAAVEGLRVAAGLAAWQQLKISVYLIGPAAALLDIDSHDLKDGDQIAGHLETLRQMGASIEQLTDEAASVTDDKLARLAAQPGHLLSF